MKNPEKNCLQNQKSPNKLFADMKRVQVGSNPAGVKDFSLILVLISNFFFQTYGRGKIAHF